MSDRDSEHVQYAITYGCGEIDWGASTDETESGEVERSVFPTGHVEIPADPAHTKEKTKEINVRKSFNVRQSRANESAILSLYPDWRTGSYEEAFRELSAASEDVENIELKNVPARIEAINSAKEHEIEVFGLKIPASQVTQLGTFLILAAQLYFWLHLCEINARMAPSSPGKRVAWIGGYKSVIAQISTMTSACILPLLAVGLLACGIPGSAGGGGHNRIAWLVALAVILASCALALLTALHLRRLNVKLANQG
jgi:hypothetical protein